MLQASPAAQNYLLRNLVRFVRLLREVGIDATPPQILALVDGLSYIDLGRREDVKNAARAVLVGHPEHLALFDRAFDLFWQAPGDADLVSLVTGRYEPKDPRPPSDEQVSLDQRGTYGSKEETLAPQKGSVQTYSDLELLRRKDFARLTPEELAEIQRLLRAMSWQLEQRRTRRRLPAPHGADLDMRRLFRKNLRYGGEPLELAWLRPKLRRRPLVVICDVSGSMEPYARILLKFIYAISSGLESVEAFTFSTRLTRITRQIKDSDIDQALDRVVAEAKDWGSGTRIGEALKRFNYEWGRRVLGQGAIVLLISDGLDRGDIGLLAREMSRLRLTCKRLIWLNPLLGSPQYRPLARGIRAALPYVDDFLPVHNLASLEELGRLLRTLGERRSGWERVPNSVGGNYGTDYHLG
jgi:uncharacterized protein